VLIGISAHAYDGDLAWVLLECASVAETAGHEGPLTVNLPEPNPGPTLVDHCVSKDSLTP
jgi:hypothetical protein